MLSALMTAPPNSWAMARARADLPLAVGPATITNGRKRPSAADGNGRSLRFITAGAPAWLRALFAVPIGPGRLSLSPLSPDPCAPPPIGNRPGDRPAG